MDCPKCGKASLAESQAAAGLAVDVCRACGGVWLDRSEIYRFVKYPHRLHQEFVKAYEAVYPSSFSCPRCARMMLHAKLETGDMEFEACPGCGGNWFDAREIEKLQGEIVRSVEGAAAERGSGEAAGGESCPPPRPLTDMEIASVYGSGLAEALAIVAGAGAFLAAAVGLLLGAMRKIPVLPRDVGVFLLCAAPVVAALYGAAKARRRRVKEARLVRGSVVGVKNLSSGPWGELELSVRYAFAGARHQVVGRVNYRVFGDSREGSPVGVVVHPASPGDGRIVKDC